MGGTCCKTSSVGEHDSNQAMHKAATTSPDDTNKQLSQQIGHSSNPSVGNEQSPEHPATFVPQSSPAFKPGISQEPLVAGNANSSGFQTLDDSTDISSSDHNNQSAMLSPRSQLTGISEEQVAAASASEDESSENHSDTAGQSNKDADTTRSQSSSSSSSPASNKQPSSGLAIAGSQSPLISITPAQDNASPVPIEKLPPPRSKRFAPSPKEMQRGTSTTPAGLPLSAPPLNTAKSAPVMNRERQISVEAQLVSSPREIAEEQHRINRDHASSVDKQHLKMVKRFSASRRRVSLKSQDLPGVSADSMRQFMKSLSPRSQAAAEQDISNAPNSLLPFLNLKGMKGKGSDSDSDNDGDDDDSKNSDFDSDDDDTSHTPNGTPNQTSDGLMEPPKPEFADRSSVIVHDDAEKSPTPMKEKSASAPMGPTLDELADEYKRSEFCFLQSSAFSLAGAQNGKTKTNQDSYFIFDEFGYKGCLQLYGVADGHGKAGHKVSQYAAKRFPECLQSDQDLLLRDPQQALKNSFKQVSMELLEHEKEMESEVDSEKPPTENGDTNSNSDTATVDDAEQDAMKRAYRAARRGKAHLAPDSEKRKIDFDVEFSGTTLTCGLRMGDKLYLGNLGDSRTVLGRLPANVGTGRKQRGRVQSIQMTEDHAPEDPTEANRLRENGCKISVDEDGFARVEILAQTNDGRKVSTSLSRSLGDRFVSKYGVISDPDIKSYDLSPKDIFVIWASDGIWSVLENEEVGAMLGHKLGGFREVPSMDLDGVSETLVTETNKVWQSECMGYTDDITAVIARIGPCALLQPIMEVDTDAEATDIETDIETNDIDIVTPDIGATAAANDEDDDDEMVMPFVDIDDL